MIDKRSWTRDYDNTFFGFWGITRHESWWLMDRFGSGRINSNLYTKNTWRPTMNEYIYELDNTVTETLDLLEKNPEWKDRYTKYGEDISNNMEFISFVRRSFREWSPLYVYLNFTNAKNAKKSIKFELRFLGQTVADLVYNKGLKLNTRKYNHNNSKYFGCIIVLAGVDWAGSEAREFRSYFKNLKTVSNKSNEEHRIESLLLSEFPKTRNKALTHIQPVKIKNIRFPMPTPLSACNHKTVKYSGIFGGGIDILTRTGTGGPATNLCIMEVKDENIKREPPKDAVKQAVIYSTFILVLLRSSCGKLWWKLFGFSGQIPKKLVVFAACMMPSNGNNDYSFEGMDLIVGNDVIRLHYGYFTEESNKIRQIESSLNN